LHMSLFFFFFQAEDGIRDLIVTGVETCALPISALLTPLATPEWVLSTEFMTVVVSGATVSAIPNPVVITAGSVAAVADAVVATRSEERRVGKECSGGRGRAARRGRDRACRLEG